MEGDVTMMVLLLVLCLSMTSTLGSPFLLLGTSVQDSDPTMSTADLGVNATAAASDLEVNPATTAANQDMSRTTASVDLDVDSSSSDQQNIVKRARGVFSLDDAESNSGPEHYGVLLDAGSSSTKLKIYKWTRPATRPGVPTVTLVKIADKSRRKFKPGLSHVQGVPAVRSYLLNILAVAEEIIPVQQHGETPVFLLATAGFRLLGVDGAREGMEDVEEVLLNSTLHPFRYTPGGASFLSGEEEGAYAWLAANYLLGFFQDKKPDTDSVGVLEMGGGSTQIAFIPHDPLMAEEFQVIMAGRRYSLYVQSYLEFGLNAIRRRLEGHIASQCPGLDTVEQPCMLKDDEKNFTVSKNNTILFQGTGKPAECRKLFDMLVASAPPQKCYLPPCAIGSVFQPSVKGIDFYASSAFVYSPRTVGAVRDDHTLDLQHLWRKAKRYCERNISEVPAKSKKFASVDCMEAIYFNELLTRPYGFPESTNRIKVTGKINGSDIDWALGAMLEFLSLSFTGDPSHVSVTRR